LTLAHEPIKIGGVIRGYLEHLGFSGRLGKQTAVLQWAEIAGPKIADETEALRIDGDTLVVKVSRAAWRQQLTFLKNDLLVRLESKLGKGVIEDIRFI
jgi:hypothetical protein